MATLVACASSHRRAQWAAPPQAVEAVYEASSGNCWVRAGGVTLSTRGHYITKRSLERALPRRRVAVMVYAEPAVPTSCPGMVINKLRDSGYRPAGFATRER